MPTEAEIRAMGFAPEDYADDYVECWPEHWAAFRVFACIANQWRMGPGGLVALDYTVLFHRMDRLDLTPDDHEQMFEDVRELEAAALRVHQRPAAKA